MSFLGIDMGTSGLRLLLTDQSGAPLASSEAHYSACSPQEGWSEQDPADWIAALNDAIGQLRSTCPAFAQLQGIAVAGHMHGAVLLDASDKVLRPCILWNDTRSAEQARRLDAAPAFREITGNIVFAGFTAPKLDWVRHNEPDIFGQVAKVLLPAAYLNLYLTGAHVGDISDAAGTGWLDVRSRDWSGDLLAATNMSRAQMPRLVEGSAPAGSLRPALSAAWGLTSPVTVAGGAADNAAAACGIGALAEGDGFISLGTSGVVLLARDSCRPDPASAVHSFCHAVPERWYQMGVMLAATDSLNWLSRTLGRAPAELTKSLGDQLARPAPLLFLPYLSGERTPHNDAQMRGGFVGLGIATTAQDMTRAVLEGVAFALRDNLLAVQGSGRMPQTLYAIGGGSASDYWLKLLATVLDVPLLRPDGGEFGAALGAARLARCAATGAAPEDIMTRPQNAMRFTPDAALTDAYTDAYNRFKSAYPALRSLM